MNDISKIEFYCLVNFTVVLKHLLYNDTIITYSYFLIHIQFLSTKVSNGI